MTGNSAFLSIGILMLLAVTACGDGKETSASVEDVLVTVGDSSLYMNDVVRRIPTGLASEDSAAMFDRIVDGWVESMILTEVASENVSDLERINRMAEDYRKGLIIESYLRNMEETSSRKVSDAQVAEYYAANKDDMILESPLIKGVYLKTADKDEQIANIRKWMETATENSIDNIEKYGMRLASQYEYFADEWVEWNNVAELIPYKFFDADAFLQSTSNFETSYAGSTYFLHIYDYVSSGQPMPPEYAAKRIRDILSEKNSSTYRDNLIRRIYRQKITDKVLKPGLYDPLSGKMRKSVQTHGTEK